LGHEGGESAKEKGGVSVRALPYGGVDYRGCGEVIVALDWQWTPLGIEYRQDHGNPLESLKSLWQRFPEARACFPALASTDGYLVLDTDYFRHLEAEAVARRN
jgi:hypothetical protein